MTFFQMHPTVKKCPQIGSIALGIPISSPDIQNSVFTFNKAWTEKNVKCKYDIR